MTILETVVSLISGGCMCYPVYPSNHGGCHLINPLSEVVGT